MATTPSPAQSEASRQNGARSTGAATEAGKARSALNSVRHGLCGRTFFLLPDEDPAEFREHGAMWLAVWSPRDLHEHQAAEAAIRAMWREIRADRLEVQVLTDLFAAGEIADEAERQAAKAVAFKALARCCVTAAGSSESTGQRCRPWRPSSAPLRRPAPPRPNEPEAPTVMPKVPRPPRRCSRQLCLAAHCRATDRTRAPPQPPSATRPGRDVPARRLSNARAPTIQPRLADERQLPIPLGIVDAVADHEHVGDGEADEVDLAPLDLAARRLVEQGAGPDLAAPRSSRNARVKASVRPVSWMSSTSSTGSPLTPAGASPIRLTMPELVVPLP